MRKRKKYKSVISKRIFQSVKKVGLVLTVLLLTLSLGKMQGTNSFFTDTASTTGNTITAGYWIPVLTMSVDPASPDGQSGWYVTTPCITLTSTISDVTIHYSFTHNSSSIVGSYAYPGSCISVPEGKWDFSAYAVNNANSSWTSNTVTGSFKVDTQCPFVEITNPDDGDTLSGTVEIRGTVTDANPHHYWLVIQNSSGSTVAGPGTVNDTNSFTNKKFFDWNTTAAADGNYTIKLEARDEAGNKCPNLAPVPADPEDLADSVDWINATVNNSVTVSAGDVVINEIMWMGSDGDSDDEWIELRNTTGHDIDLSNWDIENGGSGSGHIEIPHGYEIKANGFFLITRKKWDETKINLGSDLNNDQGYTHVSGMSLHNNGEKLTLEDNYNNVIDTAWKDSSNWPEGINSTLKQSMERNDTPGNGTLAGSWHTCTDEHCNDTTYWDSEGNNYGTPGHSNLSEDDPTSKDYKPSTVKKDGDEPLNNNPANTETAIDNGSEETGEESASGEEATEENNTDETTETTDEPVIVPEENGEDESSEAEESAASAPEENAGTDEDADNIDSDNNGGDTASSDTQEEIKDSDKDEEETAEVKKDGDDEEKTDEKASAIKQKDDDEDEKGDKGEKEDNDKKDKDDKEDEGEKKGDDGDKDGSGDSGK